MKKGERRNDKKVQMPLFSIAPSISLIILWAREEILGLWVITTRVWPCFQRFSKIARISSPDLVSKFPVGSSANIYNNFLLVLATNPSRFSMIFTFWHAGINIS